MISSAETPSHTFLVKIQENKDWNKLQTIICCGDAGLKSKKTRIEMPHINTRFVARNYRVKIQENKDWNEIFE